MNQWTPEWDMRPPSPDDYRPETPGPFTPPKPNLPDPYKPQTVQPPAWSVLIVVGACVALLIGGLYVSASRDTTPVPIPNVSPAPERFTPNVHKPGPPVRTDR